MQIVVFLTPFHVKSFLAIQENHPIPLGSHRVIFYHQRLLNYPLLDGVLGSKIAIPLYGFFKEEFIKQPMMLFSYKKKMRQLIGFIGTHIPKIDKVSALFFSNEKDVFTQLLIYVCKQQIGSYISIEEGVGHYKTNQWQDYFWKNVYVLLSPLILGFPYQYYRVLGTYPTISVLYIRYPELLPFRKQQARIIPFRITPVDFNQIHSDSTAILFFTSPFSEYHLESTEKAFHRVEEMIHVMVQLGYKVCIKPHPSEDIFKYRCLNLVGGEVLSSHILPDEIDYAKYAYLVHFTSSIILDVLSTSYPKERVLTYITPHKDSSVNHLFEGTKQISTIRELKNQLK